MKISDELQLTLQKAATQGSREAAFYLENKKNCQLIKSPQFLLIKTSNNLTMQKLNLIP
jgi:hypothetical protein